MLDIRNELMLVTEKSALCQLSKKYSLLVEKLFQEGGYIWGTGRLGHFVFNQCKRKNLEIKGYIDNNSEKWNVKERIFSHKVLLPNDVVIIASLYFPDIIEQLEAIGVKNYIYYEELAFLVKGLDTYSLTFQNIFGELEINKERYRAVYDLLEDELSKEIYSNIVSYRSTLDAKYTRKAFKLSLQEGIQDFDRIVMSKLDSEYDFFDVGGFDGESTIEYISHSKGEYHQIYFFEPDKRIIADARKRLKNYRDIIFVQAGVGEKRELKNYDARVNGSGTFLEDGGEKIELVTLDDYVDSHKSYIKMDIEGYELSALKGAEQSIRVYKPMLSVSVYHLPGDIHQIIQLVLSWNPKYKVYMRHYSNSYVDTRVYFVEE